MVKVKICGMTNLRDALKAHELGADMAGFIFFEKSPRRLEAERARVMIEDLPDTLIKVGLFLDHDPDFVRETASRCRLDMVQLHGNESPAYCAELSKDIKVMKSFKIKDKEGLKGVNKYTAADFFLFDTYSPDMPGGTGKTFDWSILEGQDFLKPVFLAGGLRPDNVRKAVETVRPYAVDVASGVEKAPGVKDYKLMKEFIQNAKSA